MIRSTYLFPFLLIYYIIFGSIDVPKLHGEDQYFGPFGWSPRVTPPGEAVQRRTRQHNVAVETASLTAQPNATRYVIAKILRENVM